MDNITAFWILLAIIFGVAEAATAGLVSVWFCIGAVISAVVSTVTPSLYVQFAVFVISSALLLASTRGFAKRFLSVKKTATNADAIIGCDGIVTKDIDPMQNTGQIKVNGQIWSARCNTALPAGEKVVVKAITGVKAIVEKEEA